MGRSWKRIRRIILRILTLGIYNPKATPLDELREDMEPNLLRKKQHEAKLNEVNKKLDELQKERQTKSDEFKTQLPNLTESARKAQLREIVALDARIKRLSDQAAIHTAQIRTVQAYEDRLDQCEAAQKLPISSRLKEMKNEVAGLCDEVVQDNQETDEEDELHVEMDDEQKLAEAEAKILGKVVPTAEAKVETSPDKTLAGLAAERRAARERAETQARARARQEAETRNDFDEPEAEVEIVPEDEPG